MPFLIHVSPVRVRSGVLIISADGNGKYQRSHRFPNERSDNGNRQTPLLVVPAKRFEPLAAKIWTTPYQLLRKSKQLPSEALKKLDDLYHSLNPADLKRRIDQKLKKLYTLYEKKRNALFRSIPIKRSIHLRYHFR
jgi:hypothetical protein